MSLGWVVAAIKIRPFEVGGTDRAALVALAEQTPKGSTISWASQEDLMATANVTTLSGIAKVLGRLAKLGLVEQVERGRYKHEARYALLFEEWVFDEAAKRWRPPDEVGCPPGQPSGDQPPEDRPEDGCPDGQATGGLVIPEDTVGCPVGQPIRVPSVDTDQIRIDRNLHKKQREDSDTRIINAVRAATGTTIKHAWVPNVRRAIFGGDGTPPDHIRDPDAYAEKAIANEPDPRGRFLPSMHATPTAQPEPLPKWCGECGVSDGYLEEHVRANKNLRYRGGRKCTACHPDAHPRTAAAGEPEPRPRQEPPEPPEPGEPAPPPQAHQPDPPAEPTAPPAARAERQADPGEPPREPPATGPAPGEEAHRKAQMAALREWAAANGNPITPLGGTTP